MGEGLVVSFQRTLRIPDDGHTYPLPPGFGSFTIHRAADFEGRVPAGWGRGGDVFIPMYQREALWIAFDVPQGTPHAVKVGVGHINAVSGEGWDAELRADPQDYLVCPEQFWLDGINAGDEFIRQFVAVPLGAGYSVEAQVSGREEVGGIQLLVFKPKAAILSLMSGREGGVSRSLATQEGVVASAEMGLAAGGRMRQKIYPDPYGVEAWDQDDYGSVFVHIVNSEQYEALTGRKPPPTPIDARAYTTHGFPWFDVYDEGRGDVAASEKLGRVKSVGQLDVSKDASAVPDEPLRIDNMKVLRPGRSEESD